MEKGRFQIGLVLLLGLILGSLFTNYVYHDYLAYGEQLSTMILSSDHFYVSGRRLLPYIMFKRGKQYGIVFLLGYLLQPQVFLYVGIFVISFFFSSVLSLQIIGSGILGVLMVILSLFPHYICYGGAIVLLYRRNKKEGTSYPYMIRDSLVNRYSVQIEILCMLVGTLLESYLNPSILNAFSHIVK